ncbi:MAG TPA: HNH endonuclease signature motif containing protein [Actinomycetes bacterium]
MRLRDGGCRFCGCDRPADWCEVHHLLPWSLGGRTDLHTLALLCSRHHHTIHDHGDRMTRGPDGTLHTHRPDGTEIPDHARAPSPLAQATATWTEAAATS